MSLGFAAGGFFFGGVNHVLRQNTIAYNVGNGVRLMVSGPTTLRENSIYANLAEGNTGPYFDLFVLIANPGATDAQVTATYLLPDGSTRTKNYLVPANSRFNIWVDQEELPAGSGRRPLADTAVSTTITSSNGVPLIVERAMCWRARRAA